MKVEKTFFNSRKMFFERKNEMKKIFIVFVLVMSMASAASAADFTPTLLKLSAPGVVQYDFDGTELDIPVTVSGTYSATSFCVYTKGKADQIIGVKNGFLGWHYVNKIDTCIYASDFINYFDVGSNTITWDGKDNDGNMVPAGEYTYYLWGFDNLSIRTPMTHYMGQPAASGGTQAVIIEFDENDLPLEKPIWYTKNTFQKWVIGSDPEDGSLVETIDISSAIPGWAIGHSLCFEPGDYSNFFVGIGNTGTTTLGVYKLTWVPNGTAEIVTDWGEDGATTYPGTFDADAGVVTNGTHIFNFTNNYHNTETPDAELAVLDIEDGSITTIIDISPWWSSLDDFENGGLLNGGPHGIHERNGVLYANSTSSCLKQALNPLAEDEEDFVVWENRNGDYFFDKNWEEESERPWACHSWGALMCINLDADENDFVVGLAARGPTFHLFGPDGTGVGLGIAAGDSPGRHHYTLNVDNDGSYDGIYLDFDVRDHTEWGYEPDTFVYGVYYLGQDSMKGIITSSPVSVDADAPVGFSVGQNSPNPFNPTTTISFSLAEPGNVNVEVFNTAGQKVDTIANEFMSSGNHSVSWEASGFSAGVYFYSVKSGGFSETRKMTLLK